MGAGGDAEEVVLFTATPSFTWVLRDVLVNLGTTGSMIFYLHLFAGSRIAVLMYETATAGKTIHLDCRQVLEAGDYLRGYATGGTWNAVLTGYQLVK